MIVKNYLIGALKKIVGSHPVLVIIDDTHDHKMYARAIPTSRNCTQVYYCKVHKRYETNNTTPHNSNKRPHNERILHTNRHTLRTTKSKGNTKRERRKSRIQNKNTRILGIPSITQGV